MKINALQPEKYLILCVRGVSAATPIECLVKFCQPFFERAVPINVGVIPNINCASSLPDGSPDPALYANILKKEGYLSITTNTALIDHLKQHHAYEIVQNGCHHDYQEFYSSDQSLIMRSIEEGRSHMIEAGLGAPRAFLAPYDQLSSIALFEIAKHFNLISAAGYDTHTVPRAWLPQYAWKLAFQKHHWLVGQTLLLSHMVCSLAASKPPKEALEQLKRAMAAKPLNVINFYFWESVHDKSVGLPLIDMLQQFADHIVANVLIKVIVFSELIDNPQLFKNLC